jgi:hypothetical protein
MTLPPDRLVSVYDFILFVKQHPLAPQPEADIFGETPEEIRADEERWDREYAVSRDQLRTMAREAAAEYRVGRTSPMQEIGGTASGTMVEALYDGAVLRLVEPLTLTPNTRVWVTIETAPPAKRASRSFLATARSLNLDGPADWSANLERYLYGDRVRNEG